MTDPLDPYAAFTTRRCDTEVVPALAALRREPKPAPSAPTSVTRCPRARSRSAPASPAERRPVVRALSGAPRAPWSMHTGSFVAVDTASDRVVTVHTLGRFVGTADRVAQRLVRRHRSAG